MRTILTLSAAVVLAAACAPRPYSHPAGEAPYLLHVPPPGTDYRYRSGPQGFGRTGPVLTPGPAYAPLGPGPHARDYRYESPPPDGPLPGYGYEYEAHGYAPGVYGYSDGYAWSDRRRSVRGGSSYQSREMMTEQTWAGGGVILEREPDRYEVAPGYPGPYAVAPPHRAQPPLPVDDGPEAFY